MMKTRSFGLFLMVAGACAYGAGCSSSGGGGGTGGHGVGGSTGTGGTTGVGGGTGVGGHGTGGSTGTDAGTDANLDVAVDGPNDAPADVSDAGVAPTFTQVFAILSNITTPNPDTSPGCANCHDGANTAADAAPTTLPHLLNFKNKAIAFQQLVGIDSLRCTSADGGTAVKRVVALSPDTSILVQKVRQGLGIGTACDGVAMPINRPVVVDGGGQDASGTDAGFLTHYGITTAQLQTIVGWVAAGAQNN